MRYTNSQWTVAGTTGFSPGTAQFLRLAMHPATGDPYVAYADSLVSNKAIVQKFNGSSGKQSVQPDSALGLAVDMFFAINPDTGEPYLAFGDYSGSNGKVSVMKYDGSILAVCRFSRIQRGRQALLSSSGFSSWHLRTLYCI